MPYVSRADRQRTEYITIPEAVTHICKCDRCDAALAQQQLHLALKNGVIRGLRWEDQQMPRFCPNGITVWTDDSPISGRDWAEAEINWEAGTVRDDWGEAGPRHRVLLMPRWSLLQNWPPAGYRPAWHLFAAGCRDVERAAQCSADDAIEGLRAALSDGAVRSRYADGGEAIAPERWMPPLVLVDDDPIVGEADRPIEVCRADIERLWGSPPAERSGVYDRRIRIADAIKAVAARMSASPEQAWRAIKSECVAGSLSLEGTDDKGRPRAIERHWVRYISVWGRELPGGGLMQSDLPHDDMLAFDRQAAHRHALQDASDRLRPQSLPPMRLRDVAAVREEIAALWSRAEHEFTSADWSLGNVLSWITFKDPLLICEFDNRHDLLAHRRYDHRRSGFLYAEPVIANADRVLLQALQHGRLTAIRGGSELQSVYWFGKEPYHLTDDLRCRRAEVMAVDWKSEVPDPHASGGPLVALNAAIERYPENRGVVMRRIEAVWQRGEIALWGRRKGHAMPEPIRDYRGLVISWHASAPKGDYYAEAAAHPAEPGVGYHRHEWEDLTIEAVELDRFYDAPATQNELLRNDIASALDSERATPAVAAPPSTAPPLPRRAVSDSELRAWYLERIAAGTPTSEEDDWEAANKKFGALARRDAVRKLRRELAPPAWRKRGRRKSAEKAAK